MLPRLRASVSEGTEEVPQVDIEKGLSAVENLIHSLIVTRVPVKKFSENLESLSKWYEKVYNLASLNNLSHTVAPVSVSDSIKMNIESIRHVQFWLPKLLDYALVTLESVKKIGFDVSSSLFYQLKIKLNELVLSVDEVVYSDSTSKYIENFGRFYNSIVASLNTWKVENSEVSFVADVVLKWISNNSTIGEITNSTSLESLESVEIVEKNLEILRIPLFWLFKSCGMSKAR